MKRKLLFLAALSAFTSSVQAQSSVTLYGVLDEGVMFQSNNGGGRRVSCSACVSADERVERLGGR